jgi:hypothetical protein
MVGPPDGKPRWDGHRAIWLQRIDLATFMMAGPRRVIVDGGTDPVARPFWIEGPHLFRSDGAAPACPAAGADRRDAWRRLRVERRFRRASVGAAMGDVEHARRELAAGRRRRAAADGTTRAAGRLAAAIAAGGAAAAQEGDRHRARDPAARRGRGSGSPPIRASAAFSRCRSPRCPVVAASCG